MSKKSTVPNCFAKESAARKPEEISYAARSGVNREDEGGGPPDFLFEFATSMGCFFELRPSETVFSRSFELRSFLRKQFGRFHFLMRREENDFPGLPPRAPRWRMINARTFASSDELHEVRSPFDDSTFDDRVLLEILWERFIFCG